MLPVSTLVSLLAVILFNRRLGVVLAQMQPTTPGPGETYTAEANCTIAWVPDSSGSWTNVTIDLMSGSNNNMSLVTNVVNGLDGTDESLSPFSWTCPEVDPYSTIYFYQFTNGDDISTRAWTTRFTIASPANETELPKNTEQPDGESVPWGLGRLLSSDKSAVNSSTTANGTNSSVTFQSATASFHSAAPSDSAAPRNGRKPHGRKGDGDEDEDGSSARSRSDGYGWDGESATRPARSSRTANVAGATSAAARATGIAHSQEDVPPPADSDDASPGSGTENNGSSRAHDSYSSNYPDSDTSGEEGGEEGEYQAQSPLSNSDADPNADAYPYPSYKNSGAADAADSARAAAAAGGGCHCYGAAENDAHSTQLELSASGILPTIGPSVLIALVVLYL